METATLNIRMSLNEAQSAASAAIAKARLGWRLTGWEFARGWLLSDCDPRQEPEDALGGANARDEVRRSRSDRLTSGQACADTQQANS